MRACSNQGTNEAGPHNGFNVANLVHESKKRQAIEIGFKRSVAKKEGETWRRKKKVLRILPLMH
jgi:hypothetical protein